MASLSNHVSISITVDSVGLARAGFGIPAMLSYNVSGWGASERVRFYSSLSEVAGDFPTTTGPEYLAAQALFSQEPRPDQIAVLRGSLAPTQRYTLSANEVTNSALYSIGVAGDGVTSDDAEYTADASTSAAEIHNGMVAALNAITGKNFTAAFAALVFADATFTATAATDQLTITAHGLQTGDGPFQATNSGGGLPGGMATLTNYYVVRVDANNIKIATSLANALAGTTVDISSTGTGTHTLADTVSTVRPSDPFTVTGDAAGEWFSLCPASRTQWNIVQDHTDPGVATDLAAALVADSSWFALVTMYNSDAYVKAVAAWAQSNRKLYFADSCESEAILEASDGTQGTLDDLKALGYSYVAGYWHENPSKMIAAAAAGNFCAYDPGQATAKFKSLIGVGASALTTTQRTNLVNRRANFLETVSGVSIVSNGTVFSTSIGYIDVRRDLDYVESNMATNVFGALAGLPKIPYTDAGIAVIEAEVRAALRDAVEKTIFADDPAPTVTVPRAANVSTADKADRLLANVKWSATLAGAIHEVQITGVVSA